MVNTNGKQRVIIHLLGLREFQRLWEPKKTDFTVEGTFKLGIEGPIKIHQAGK